MDKFFTYLNYKNNIQLLEFLDKEIESLDALIDLSSNFKANKMSHDG
tara:strand:- start:3 stop:143 length:141 start_codon:yes stop_codon:yes gene_type:complete